MNILLFSVLVVLIALFGLFVFAILKIRSTFRQFKSFITPAEDGKASPMALLAQSYADMMGRSLVAQIKGTFMGKQSGESRAETAIAGDIVQDIAGQQLPLAGALLESFPALKRTLKRNPALMDYALSKLAGLASGSNGDNHSKSVENSPKFKL